MSPDVDDFQNLMLSSLSKDMSLVKILVKMITFYVKLLTDKQTDRQTLGKK